MCNDWDIWHPISATISTTVETNILQKYKIYPELSYSSFLWIYIVDTHNKGNFTEHVRNEFQYPIAYPIKIMFGIRNIIIAMLAHLQTRLLKIIIG